MTGCILQPHSSVPQNPQHFPLQNSPDTCCTVSRYFFLDIHLLESCVNTIHRVFFCLFRRLKDGDEERCLKIYRRLAQTIPWYCEKTQVCTCFYLRHKEGDSRQKLSKLCWKPEAKDKKKKKNCISYSKWTFHEDRLNMIFFFLSF